MTNRAALTATVLYTLATACSASPEPAADIGDLEPMSVSFGVPVVSPPPVNELPSTLLSFPGESATLRSTVGAPEFVTPERKIAEKLGLPSRFAIGLGNDVSGGPASADAYGLGPKVDIHYLYLSGLDWTSWSGGGGAYVTEHAEEAKARGVVPMFTLYQAAAWGEGNLGAFANGTFMTSYWRGVRTLFERLGDFDAPAMVHFEPDFWGYVQRQGGDDPSKVKILVGSRTPECAGLPETVAGFGACLVKLARTLAPKTVVGFSASTFGAYTNGAPDALRVATYLEAVGGAADFVVIETLDRDAGCFERGIDPLCQRSGSFYWSDEDFANHLAWANAIRKKTKKPLLWWQMPLGVPSGNPGGWAGRYRDNRVKYLFTHPSDFVAAGGFGAVFGTGAPNQTTAKTDGGQFATALTAYLATPTALP
jgi:hypothetical protein